MLKKCFPNICYSLVWDVILLDTFPIFPVHNIIYLAYKWDSQTDFMIIKLYLFYVVEALVRCLEDESVCVGVSIGIVTADRLANQLKRLLTTNTRSLLLTDEQKVCIFILMFVYMHLSCTYSKTVNHRILCPAFLSWNLA